MSAAVTAYLDTIQFFKSMKLFRWGMNRPGMIPISRSKGVIEAPEIYIQACAELLERRRWPIISYTGKEHHITSSYTMSQTQKHAFPDLPCVRPSVRLEKHRRPSVYLTANPSPSHPSQASCRRGSYYYPPAKTHSTTRDHSCSYSTPDFHSQRNSRWRPGPSMKSHPSSQSKPGNRYCGPQMHWSRELLRMLWVPQPSPGGKGSGALPY